MATCEKYFEELENQLNHLTEEEREEAMRFYREFAEDAGLSEYGLLVTRFGTPKELAAQIYAETSKKIEKNKGEGRNLRSFLLSLCALLSLPITVPLAFGLIIFILSLVFAVIVCIGSLFSAVLSVGVSGLALLYASGKELMIGDSISWLQTLGSALMMIGATIFLSVLFFVGFNKCLAILTRVINRMIERRRDDEK